MANQVVEVVLRSQAANETKHLGNWSSYETKVDNFEVKKIHKAKYCFIVGRLRVLKNNT